MKFMVFVFAICFFNQSFADIPKPVQTIKVSQPEPPESYQAPPVNANFTPPLGISGATPATSVPLLSDEAVALATSGPRLTLSVSEVKFNGNEDYHSLREDEFCSQWRYIVQDDTDHNVRDVISGFFNGTLTPVMGLFGAKKAGEWVAKEAGDAVGEAVADARADGNNVFLQNSIDKKRQSSRVDFETAQGVKSFHFYDGFNPSKCDGYKVEVAKVGKYNWILDTRKPKLNDNINRSMENPNKTYLIITGKARY